jgi:hypothetical protein
MPAVTNPRRERMSTRGNLPICSTCKRRGTFPATTDGHDTAEYVAYRTGHGYAYCEVCAGDWTRVLAPDGEYVSPFPLPAVSP